MHDEAAVAAMAALSICESLILSLQDQGVLEREETAGLLQDVISAHRNVASKGVDADFHNEIAALVARIMAGENVIHCAVSSTKRRNPGA